MGIIRGLLIVIFVFIGFYVAINILAVADPFPISRGAVVVALVVSVVVSVVVAWVGFKLLQLLSRKYTVNLKIDHPESARQEKQDDNLNGEDHHVAKTAYKFVSSNMSRHELYDAALEKEKAGHVSDAIKLYSQLIEEYPGTQEAEMAMSARDNIKEVFKIRIEQNEQIERKEQKDSYNFLAIAAYYLVAFTLACGLIFTIRIFLFPAHLYLIGHNYPPSDYYGQFNLLSIFLGVALYAKLHSHIKVVKEFSGGEALITIFVLFFTSPVFVFLTLILFAGSL